MRAGGLDPALLIDGDAYVPFNSVVRTFEIAAMALDKPDLGMEFGVRQESGITGPLAIAVANSTTAREGVECALRFVRFHNRALHLAIESVAPGFEIVTQRLTLAQPTPHMQQFERTVAFMHNVLRRFCGDEYAASEVWFTHAQNAPLDSYQRVFGVAPRFEQARTGIVVASAQLDAVRPGRSRFVRDIAIAYLEQLCPSESTPITDRVRTALELMMQSGDGAQVEVARALGMHERTLQRRLKQEGAVFEEIKDDIRRARAEDYLRRRSLPLSQVAELLGYAEPSALSRSCRRWFGASPRDVRKRLVA